MNTLADEIEQACKALGLETKTNFNITLDDGYIFNAIAYIPNLGSPNGMLIGSFANFSNKILEELIQKGYGLSIMGEPTEEMKVDPHGWMDTFREWGWTGNADSKPKWMNN